MRYLKIEDCFTCHGFEDCPGNNWLEDIPPEDFDGCFDKNCPLPTKADILAPLRAKIADQVVESSKFRDRLHDALNILDAFVMEQGNE